MNKMYFIFLQVLLCLIWGCSVPVSLSFHEYLEREKEFLKINNYLQTMDKESAKRVLKIEEVERYYRGRYEKAIQLLRAGKDDLYTHKKRYAFLAQAYYGLGKEHKAVRYLKKEWKLGEKWPMKAIEFESKAEYQALVDEDRHPSSYAPDAYLRALSSKWDYKAAWPKIKKEYTRFAARNYKKWDQTFIEEFSRRWDHKDTLLDYPLFIWSQIHEPSDLTQTNMEDNMDWFIGYVEENGWPVILKRGGWKYELTEIAWFLSQMDNKRAETKYVLDEMMQAIREGEEGWPIAFNVMDFMPFTLTNYVEGEKMQGYMELFYVDSFDNGGVNIEASDFPLHTLGVKVDKGYWPYNFSRNVRYPLGAEDVLHVELFIIAYEGEEADELLKFQQGLVQIRDFLIAEKYIDENQLSIKLRPVKLDKQNVFGSRFGAGITWSDMLEEEEGIPIMPYTEYVK